MTGPATGPQASAADLVIATVAIEHKMTVSRESRDGETVARFVPELKRHRLGQDSPSPKEMSAVDA